MASSDLELTGECLNEQPLSVLRLPDLDILTHCQQEFGLMNYLIAFRPFAQIVGPAVKSHCASAAP